MKKYSSFEAGKAESKEVVFPGIFRKKSILRKCSLFLAVLSGIFLASGCGKAQEEGGAENLPETEIESGINTEKNSGESDENSEAAVADDIIASESAADAEVDFEALKAENPDIFAWLYVPGTEIDCPVLQSGEADDFYESHDAWGNENTKGAVYTEMANLIDMTDFNTVFHGKAGGDGNFGDLYQYADLDFFEKNEKLYLYIEGNVLVYEIFAAYEREDDSLIRRYNFTSAEGCGSFLEELYRKEIGKQIREGWEGLTPNHFLVTLTTKADEGSGRQFVVAAALIEDAAGTIFREAFE